MATCRSTSGKSNTLTSSTLKVLIEDVLFSVQQDYDTTAAQPPFRHSREI